jgi:hypothetical protein
MEIAIKILLIVTLAFSIGPAGLYITRNMNKRSDIFITGLFAGLIASILLDLIKLI